MVVDTVRHFWVDFPQDGRSSPRWPAAGNGSRAFSWHKKNAKPVQIDLDTVVSVISVVVVTPLLWVIRAMLRDIRTLDKELSDHKTHVAETYVEKDDLHRELADIKRLIGKLFDKLDAIGKGKG